MSKLILPLLAFLFVVMHYEVTGSPAPRGQHSQLTKVRSGPRIYHPDSKRWPYFYRAWYLPSFPSLSSVSSFWDDDEEDAMKAMKKKIEALEKNQVELLALLKNLTAEKASKTSGCEEGEQPKGKPASGEAENNLSVVADEGEGAKEQSTPSTMIIAAADGSEAAMNNVTEKAEQSAAEGQKVPPPPEKDVSVKKEETVSANEQRPVDNGETTSRPQVDETENPEPIRETEKPQIDLVVGEDVGNSTPETDAGLNDERLEVQESNEENNAESGNAVENVSEKTAAEIGNEDAPQNAEIAVVAFMEPTRNDGPAVENISESQTQ